MSATQIVTRQIADGAINDAKVAAGANIASSKLADGANFLKKDGSVAMTGSFNAGGNALTNLATPSANGDAATKAYVDTQIGNLNSIFKSKGGARAASTGNVTISNPGTSSFDGVTLNNGDRLFLRSQTAQAEQGLYIFNGASAPLTRDPQMDAWAEIPGSFFAVEEGSTFADSIWLCTSNQGGTLGTTPITFQQIPTSPGLSNSNFVDKEIPTGAINGLNTSFTLASTPVAGSEHGYLNGLLLEAGAGNDYTISGATITMSVAPLTGEKLRFSYRK